MLDLNGLTKRSFSFFNFILNPFILNKFKVYFITQQNIIGTVLRVLSFFLSARLDIVEMIKFLQQLPA